MSAGVPSTECHRLAIDSFLVSRKVLPSTPRIITETSGRSKKRNVLPGRILGAARFAYRGSIRGPNEIRRKEQSGEKFEYILSACLMIVVRASEAPSSLRLPLYYSEKGCLILPAKVSDGGTIGRYPLYRSEERHVVGTHETTKFLERDSSEQLESSVLETKKISSSASSTRSFRWNTAS